VVEPHVHVFSASIVSGAVSLMERLGRVEDAVGLGKRYMERYPGAESHADVARVYWRRGRYNEAAALFDASHALDVTGMRTAVPGAFVETFEHARPEDMTAAITALTAKGIDSSLILDILDTARRAGQHAKVLAAAEKLLTLPRWGVATVEGTAAAVEGWRAVKAIDGAEAAAEWIRAKVPDSAALYVVSSAYQDGENDLVLAWATPRPDPAKSIEMLAFMAAAITHARVPESDPRRVALVETVRARGEQPRSLLPVAQYLLGMMDEAAFMKWPYEPEGRAVAAYFVGLKAAAGGDYDKALPWLIAASAGAPTNPPRAWALETLSRWNNARMSWSEIRRAGIL
jgi:tetratricopeptide (TPR) repeat protein